MFERYTEKARRVIFFARYEASHYGSPHIETEHLLLGVLREDRALLHSLLNTVPSMKRIRSDVEASIESRERISTSVAVPLTQECKKALDYAAEEADGLGHRHIGTEHLLLGLLREEDCFAALLLTKYGVKLNDLREKLITPGREGFVAKIPTSPTVPIGAAVDMIVEAWQAHDAKKLTSFFADRGQVWDVHGELWVAPPQIEKGLAAHFASAEPRAVAPNIKDVKFVTREVSVVTVIWEPKTKARKSTAVQEGNSLRMVLVLRDTHPGWQIVSAHLAVMQMPKESRKKQS